MPAWWRRPGSAVPDAEKATINADKKAREIWPDKLAKAAQKDTDARWTVKSPKADGMVQSDLNMPARPSLAINLAPNGRHGAA